MAFSLGAALSLLAVACGREATQAGPADPSALGEAADQDVGSVTARAQTKVDICHRTEGRHPYVLISVSESAVPAHLAHGDAAVGDAAPGQPGMRFDPDCTPVESPVVSTSSGSRVSGSWRIVQPFTVNLTGPVHATATVVALTEYGIAVPLRLALLRYDLQAPAPNHCTLEPVFEGPEMSPPTITADWLLVPPGTYCLDVRGEAPPFGWTATITHP